MPARQVIGLDLLRFFAAAYVAFYHLGFWIWAYEPGMAYRAAGGEVSFERLAPVAAYGWIGVQIFFVISGFVIAYSAERATAFGFMVSRIVRLAPCVWLVSTLTLAVSLLFGLDSVRDLAARWVNSVLFGPWPPWVDSVYWTLCIELAFYAVVLVLIRLRRFAAIEPLMAALGVASTLFWAAWWAATQLAPSLELLRHLQASRTLQLLLLHHGCFFAIGVYFWLQLVKQPTWRRTLWMALFAVGAVLQISAEADLNIQKTEIAISPFPPALLFALTMVAFAAAVRANDALRRSAPGLLPTFRMLGLMTFPLYLLHNVIGSATLGWLAERGMPDGLALVLVLAAAALGSYVIAAHLEPPLQRWTRDRLWGLRRRPAGAS